MNYWQGQNVRLRALELGDAATLVAWDLDSESGRYMDWLTPPQSSTAIENFVARMAPKKFEDDGYLWIIEDAAGNAVGHLETKADTRHGTFEYSISVSAGNKRNGYAAEAIGIVLQYYFHHLRYQKVTVHIHADNEPSIRLHEKLGFTKEGTLRSMIFSNGDYVDLHYFGLTKAEHDAALP